MVTLKGQHIFLRALEPEDLEFLYHLENDTSVWNLSDTQTPYSKFILKQYLKNAHQDIYEAKQLRLAICKNNTETIGLIDLFDFNIKNKRAGVGIIIKDAKERGQGYGKEALQLLISFCFQSLQLYQIYANILEDNTASLQLFKTLGFEIVGVKHDWILDRDTFKNEILLQRFNR